MPSVIKFNILYKLLLLTWYFLDYYEKDYSWLKMVALGFYSKKSRNALKPIQKKSDFLVFEIGLKYLKTSQKLAKKNVILKICAMFWNLCRINFADF